MSGGRGWWAGGAAGQVGRGGGHCTRQHAEARVPRQTGAAPIAMLPQAQPVDRSSKCRTERQPAQRQAAPTCATSSSAGAAALALASDEEEELEGLLCLDAALAVACATSADAFSASATAAALSPAGAAGASGAGALMACWAGAAPASWAAASRGDGSGAAPLAASARAEGRGRRRAAGSGSGGGSTGAEGGSPARSLKRSAGLRDCATGAWLQALQQPRAPARKPLRTGCTRRAAAIPSQHAAIVNSAAVGPALLALAAALNAPFEPQQPISAWLSMRAGRGG